MGRGFILIGTLRMRREEMDMDKHGVEALWLLSPHVRFVKCMSLDGFHRPL